MSEAGAGDGSSGKKKILITGSDIDRWTGILHLIKQNISTAIQVHNAADNMRCPETVSGAKRRMESVEHRMCCTQGNIPHGYNRGCRPDIIRRLVRDICNESEDFENACDEFEKADRLCKERNKDPRSIERISTLETRKAGLVENAILLQGALESEWKLITSESHSADTMDTLVRLTFVVTKTAIHIQSDAKFRFICRSGADPRISIPKFCELYALGALRQVCRIQYELLDAYERMYTELYPKEEPSIPAEPLTPAPHVRIIRSSDLVFGRRGFYI